MVEVIRFDLFPEIPIDMWIVAPRFWPIDHFVSGGRDQLKLLEDLNFIRDKNLIHTPLLPFNILETTKIQTHQLTHFYKILCESLINASFSKGTCVEGGSSGEEEGVCNLT